MKFYCTIIGIIINIMRYSSLYFIIISLLVNFYIIINNILESINIKIKISNNAMTNDTDYHDAHGKEIVQ